MSKSLRNCKTQWIRSNHDLPCNPGGFAVVQALEVSQLLRVSFNEIGKFVDKPSTLKTRDVFPPRSFESCTGSSNCYVNVFRRG